MLPGAPTPPVPRISGSAMPGGVHMSTGVLRTSSDWQLALTGLAMAALGSGAMVLTYAVTWLIAQLTGLPLVPYLLQLAHTTDQASDIIFQIGINLLTFLCFLTLMRLSPLAGYHAAEHKVIGAIEHYGELTEELAWTMPRAHRRCGSNLLAGVLPMLLVGVPLASVNLMLGLGVIVVGWSLRMQTGYFIQMIFSTREPTAREMAAGLRSGHKILNEWRADPYKRVPPLVNMWRRGFVQMFAGLFIAMEVFGRIYEHLHIWLDF